MTTDDLVILDEGQPVLSPLRSSLEQRVTALIDEVGRWSTAHDADIEGRPIMPPRIRAMEAEIRRITQQLAPVTVHGAQTRRFTARRGNIIVTLDLGLRLAENDPLGYDPDGWRVCLSATIDGQPVGEPAWTTPEDIARAAEDWLGTGSAAERVYDTARAALRLLLDGRLVKIQRFDGYSTS